MPTPTTAPITLASIPTALSEPQRAEFFATFWTAWSANGFGTLSKKDTELLIFGCLRKAFGEQGPKTIFDWATLLRLTPTKVKTMRLEAHLRFGHLFGESSKSDTIAFLRNFAALQAIDVRGLAETGEVLEVTVHFVVEDPVVQLVIENDLKSIGSYLDFHRNREVVGFKLVDFFKIITQETERQMIDKWVAKAATEADKADSLASRVRAKGYAKLSEGGKLMAFLEDLAKFGGAESLVKHLKTVIASQKERK